MGSVIRWQEMGEKAARAGKDEADCPFAVGGAAFKWWVVGYRREAEQIEEHLLDTEAQEKRSGRVRLPEAKGKARNCG